MLFKKVIGETTFGQMSLFFSLIGLCNAALLWPICLALYFSGAESVQWGRLPWTALLAASILHLGKHNCHLISIISRIVAQKNYLTLQSYFLCSCKYAWQLQHCSHVRSVHNTGVDYCCSCICRYNTNFNYCIR